MATPPLDTDIGSSGRLIGLRSGILASGILILLAFVASSAYDLWRARDDALRSTHREIDNLAAALAEQTAWTWAGIDLLLRDTVRWYQNDHHKFTAQQLDDLLATRTAGVSQLRLITVVDAQGIQRHRSHGSTPANFDVSDRRYFTVQRENPWAGLFVSEPLMSRSENLPAIILSRRLEDEHGAFDGVIAAVVGLEDLGHLYQAVHLGPGDAIQLLTDRGVLLARNPPLGFTNTSPTLDATVAVRGAPLFVSVTRVSTEALKAWRDEAQHVAARTVLITALGILAILALRRQLKLASDAAAEREALEAQLRQSQKLEAVGTLASGIAHDFNNILGAIIGYGELAEQRAVRGSDQRRHLANVMQAAARAKSLIDRLLAFSRGSFAERGTIHVQSVVEEALDLLAANVPSHIELQRHLDAPNAGLMGDSTQIHQVVMNLCTNALQAMPRGGTLRVTLERIAVADARGVARGLLHAGPYLWLTVEDTGSGIDAAVLERIFDPFFTTKALGEGTGLGLSLVHGIVRGLGGAIDLATELDQGTRIEVWLPSPHTLVEPAREPAQRDAPLGHGEVVLIVDDQRSLVELAEETLAGLGYEPVGFTSSRAALQALRESPRRFDIMLSDEAMPELSGVELAREALVIHNTLAIVIMSGHGGEPLREDAAALGIHHVLRKPLRRHELAVTLAAALRDSTHTRVRQDV